MMWDWLLRWLESPLKWLLTPAGGLSREDRAEAEDVVRALAAHSTLPTVDELNREFAAWIQREGDAVIARHQAATDRARAQAGAAMLEGKAAAAVARVAKAQLDDLEAEVAAHKRVRRPRQPLAKYTNAPNKRMKRPAVKPRRKRG